MSSTLVPRTSRATALDTITASIVVRQSRSRADDGSMSIPDQIDAAEAWCANQTPPVNVFAVYEEPDTSGRKPLDKRKGLKQAVEDVERGVSQMILTVYFDRFARSVMTRAEVLQRVESVGGVVYTLDLGRTSNATPVSKFTGTVLAAAAELIAEQSGEKTIVSKQRNIDHGVPPFPRVTPAYVKRADGTLEPHPVNGPLVAEACKMRADGKSYSTIRRYLAEHGIVDTETGEPYTPTMRGVASMLSSKLLIGEIHFGGFTPNLRASDSWGTIEIDGRTFGPTITDPATYRRIESARAVKGRYSKSERLLARQGIVVCGTCGARLVVHSSLSQYALVNGESKRFYYYRCSMRCERPASVRAEVVEDAVRDAAIELSRDVVGRASARDDLEAARLALEAAETKLASTIKTLVGINSPDAIRETLDELQHDRDVAAEKHRRLASIASPDLTITTATDWHRLSLDGKRAVVHATIASATVTPGRGPDRITIAARLAQ